MPDVIGTFFKVVPLMGNAGSVQPDFTQLLGDLEIGSTGDFSLGAGFSHATYNPLVLAFMNTVFPPGIPGEFIDDYWVKGIGWWEQYKRVHKI